MPSGKTPATGHWRTRRLFRFAPIVAAITALPLGGCSDTRTWHGYFYENVLVNGAAELSVPYPDARSCLAGMRAYMTKAPPNSGFACARGCPEPMSGGIIADCREVVR
ncbi:hypothetical protein Y88_3261 [Novosphingobium nitrogenifigens DSM 19370]|uniref:Uncharacterized protein n=1 Tax=Novosphingobium nitrogenifigens DSM 19370 TaxID=983920 RepID=F1ZBZ3_9SPHN|nr:hypothetical protein [Novosphingobium nitrogenifigens]EGD57931.1 hypothetical protein Y88_3261 [Novosphingobium nitrogenifigens DSM 19370]